MTKAKNRTPTVWLEISLCKLIYETYRELSTKQGLEPLPSFEQRYKGSLESILESTKYKAEALNYDIPAIAACYFTHLVKSQAHFNGNKRMGVFYTIIFLDINGYRLKILRSDLTALALKLAEDKSSSTKIYEELLISYFREIVKPK